MAAPISRVMAEFARHRQLDTAVILFTAIACVFVWSKDYTAAWVSVLVPVLGLVACTTDRAANRFAAVSGMAAALAVIVLANYYVIANHGFVLLWAGLAISLASACDTPRDLVILRRNAALLLGLLMGLALLQKLASAYYMQGELLGGLLVQGEMFANALGLVVPGWGEMRAGYNGAAAEIMSRPVADQAAMAVPAVVTKLAVVMTWASLAAQAVLEAMILWRARVGIWLHVAVIGFVMLVYATRPENVFLSINGLLGYAMTDDTTARARVWYVVLVGWLLITQLVGVRPWLIG